ncbi:thiol:disulfide oxidoreductase [Allostella vacuolata]|nr:thiol:disulfide oxidoreductase [Stella vacuolata]
MIELYTWPTPNGQKVHLMLEETGLPYTVHPIDIGTGEQFQSDFLKISPNNKMPAIVDTDGPDGQPISIFESGAILMYLGEKTGRFYPQAGRARWAVNQWLMFQMASVGPMFGQRGHFRNYAPEKIPYAVDRYSNEARRICGVMDRRLGDSPYLAGDEYTIADMACYPWLASYKAGEGPVGDFPHLVRWMDAIAARPATERGMKILTERRRQGPIDEKQRAILFGQDQYARR